MFSLRFPLLVFFPRIVTALPIDHQIQLYNIPVIISLLVTIALLVSLLSVKICFLRSRRRQALQESSSFGSSASFRRPKILPRKEKKNIGYLIGLLGSPTHETELSVEKSYRNEGKQHFPSLSQNSGFFSSASRADNFFDSVSPRTHSQNNARSVSLSSKGTRSSGRRSGASQSGRPPVAASPLPPLPQARQQTSRTLPPSWSPLATFAEPYSTPPEQDMRGTPAGERRVVEQRIQSLKLSSPLSPLNLLQASFDDLPTIGPSPLFRHSPTTPEVICGRVIPSSETVTPPPLVYTAQAHPYQLNHNARRQSFRTEDVTSSTLPSDGFLPEPTFVETSPSPSPLSPTSDPSPISTELRSVDFPAVSPPLPSPPVNSAAAMIISRSWGRYRQPSRARRVSSLKPSPLRNTITAEKDTVRRGGHQHSDSVELLSMIRDLVEEASSWEESIFIDEKFKMMIEQSKSHPPGGGYRSSTFPPNVYEEDITLVGSIDDGNAFGVCEGDAMSNDKLAAENPFDDEGFPLIPDEEDVTSAVFLWDNPDTYEVMTS